MKYICIYDILVFDSKQDIEKLYIYLEHGYINDIIQDMSLSSSCLANDAHNHNLVAFNSFRNQRRYYKTTNNNQYNKQT